MLARPTARLIRATVLRRKYAPLEHLCLSRKKCRLLIVVLGVLLLLLLLLDALWSLLLREALSRILLLVHRQPALNELDVPPGALEVHPLELMLLELRGVL